jgi:hypothetical protein
VLTPPFSYAHLRRDHGDIVAKPDSCLALA